MTDLKELREKLNKRQMDALDEVARHDKNGHPHNWCAASCKVLESLGLVTTPKAELRNGYMTRVRRITPEGRALLKALEAKPNQHILPHDREGNEP